MKHLNNLSNIDLELLKEKYQGESLDIALNKVKNGYPVQYLIGNVNFCGNTIEVDESVLIPRFETEFLIDLISRLIPKDYTKRILDIGTGSGCIAISIGKIYKESTVTGIDVSKYAIDIASKNRKINNVDNVDFINKDLFEVDNFEDYEIIISNPPYVAYDEAVGTETKYEPQNAIFADNNGLVFYEEIIKKVSISKNVKHIFFEIGMKQASSIKDYAIKYIPNYTVETYKDLANKDRYMHIYLNK